MLEIQSETFVEECELLRFLIRRVDSRVGLLNQEATHFEGVK